MLICKIFLWKFLHEVRSILTFDCLDNYSDIQQNSTCKAGSPQKCSWSSRDCICSYFYFTNHLLNVSLKRKTNNILHHYMAYDYRKGNKSHWYTTTSCWYTTSEPFFPKMFIHPGLLLTAVAVYDKPNWTHNFQVAKHFGRRHSMIVGLYRRAT